MIGDNSNFPKTMLLLFFELISELDVVDQYRERRTGIQDGISFEYDRLRAVGVVFHHHAPRSNLACLVDALGRSCARPVDYMEDSGQSRLTQTPLQMVGLSIETLRFLQCFRALYRAFCHAQLQAEHDSAL